MKLFHYSKLLPERYCQINTNRSNQRFGYFLTLLLMILFSVNATEVSAQLCGEAGTTLAKWDFNTENIECNGAEHLAPTPITNPSITPGAAYCPNTNIGCSSTILGSVGHQNTPQFQGAICLANFYNVEAILASGNGAPFDPNSTTWDPNAKVNLSVWYDFPKNTEGCLEDFMLKVMQKQFNGSQLNFETQGVGVKRNGVLIFSETQPITVANVNGQPFEFNFSGPEFCSDGSELVEFEITFGLVHRLIGPAFPGTPGQTGYDDVCVRGSCQPLSYGGILPATCGAMGPNDDASVLIQNFMPGDRYDYNEGDTYTGSATFASGSTAIPADGIVPNFPNPAVNTDYSFRVFNQNCESDFTVTIEPKYCCIVPTGSLLAITPATCDGTTANNDAQITVTGVMGGTKAGISAGSTYTGPDFAGANMLTAGEFAFTGLANPLISDVYTVRVYQDATCFVDLQTSLFNESCIVPCAPPEGVVLTSTSATCTGNTRNSDAVIQVTNISGGDRVGMSPSISYSGPDYAGAAPLVNGSYTFSGINSPDGDQIYTVRVFNTSDGCYLDETIEIEDPECEPCKHPAAFVVSVGENVGEGDGSDNQTAYESCVTPGTIDLELTKTVSPNTGSTCISGGTPFVWTLTVENKGNITASGVNVVDLIPAGLDMTGSSASKGTYYGGSGWDVGDLAAGESATLDITTVALDNGTYTNCAYINDVTPDNDPDSSTDNTETANEDDDACTSITVTGNNTPLIEKSFSPMLTKPNTATRLTIKIRNKHTEPITITTDLVDDFPSNPGQMVIAGTPDLYVSNGITPGGAGITVVPGGTGLTIPSGTILEPGLNQISLDVTVPVLGDYCNKIEVGELITDIGDNCLETEACIKANPAFTMPPVITVTMDPEEVLIGQVADITITITNPNTDSMSLNQDFIYEIPPGLDIVDVVTTTGGTIVVQNNDMEVVLQSGSEIPGDSTIVIVIPVSAPNPGTFTSVVNMNEVVTTVGTNNNNGNEDFTETPLVVVPPCEVNVVLEEQSCGESGGEYFAQYNAIVNLVANIPTEGNAYLVLDGDTLQTISVPTLDPIDTLTGIQIKADGSIDHVLSLHFDGDTTCVNPLVFKAPVPCVPDVTLDCSSGIAGMVFNDVDFNGENDTEDGVKGVKVLVYDCMNNLVDSTWTDEEGEYAFPALPPGEDYRIEFEPTDAVDCWANTTNIGADSGSDIQFSESGSGECVEFGLMDPTTTPNPTIQAGNLIWEDINQNGSQDACEEGIPGVTVNLHDENGTLITSVVTDSTGNYVFTNLDPNTVYNITIGTSGQWNPTDSTIVIDGTEFELSPDSTGTNPLIDSDIEVTTNGNFTNEPVITFTTGEPGENIYDLDIGLTSCPELQVIEAQQSGTTINEICLGSSLDLKMTFTGSPGDLALYSADSGKTEAELYDYANHAANGITTVNASISVGANTMHTETNVAPASGSAITYYMILAEGNVNISPDGCMPMDSVSLVINSHTPTATLDAGPHEICSEDSPYVGVDEDVVDLSDYILSGNMGGTWTTANAIAAANLAGSVFTATTALEGQTIDFVYTLDGNMPGSMTPCDDNVYIVQITVNDCYASLGNYVWIDENGDGRQDESGTGVEDVTVELYICAGGTKGALFETTTTNANGRYLFDLLPPDEYCVKFITTTADYPAAEDLEFVGQNSTVTGATDANDSDVEPDGCTDSYTLIGGDEELTVDAGLYIPGKLGDFVWEDVNGNAVQDMNEPGIESATVTLNGTNGLGETIPTQTIATDGTGMYMFSDLYPGNYVVTFENPTGWTPTLPNDPGANGDNTSDSDGDPNDNLQSAVIPIQSGDTIPMIDCGFLVLPKLGDLIWQDYNANGIQDPGEEGFANIDLTLSGTDNLNNQVSETVTTDANGMYMFSVWPGTYDIFVNMPPDVEPSGTDMDPSGDENDSDFDENTNLTPTIVTISQDTFVIYDGGFYGEDFGDAPNSFSTNQANNGAFHIINPGKFLGTSVDSDLDGNPQATAGYAGVGGDDNSVSGYSKGVVAASGDEDGIKFLTPIIPANEACIEVTTTALEGANYLTGWIDFSGNGIFEVNEQIEWKTGGATTLDLLVANGEVTMTYCFDVPADATFDGGETHIRFRLSCEQGVQPTGVVIGGEVEDYYLPLAKVGSLVWLDYNDDGIQNEPASAGYNGLGITLTSSGSDGILGNADDYVYSTVSADNKDGEPGTWEFCGLPPGDYQVELDSDGLFPTKEGVGDEDKDSDPLIVDFTVGQFADNFPTGEDGMNESSIGEFFPDENTQLEIDWGFLAFDYGDLGDAFKTVLLTDGARHVVKSDLFLGNCVDIEADAVIDPEGTAGEGPIAGGDNADPGLFTRGAHNSPDGDEDGIRLLTPIIPGDTACIEVLSYAPQNAILNAFIDFAGDDDFADDSADAVVFTKMNGISMPNTTNAIIIEGDSVTTRFCFIVPNTAVYDGGEVHLRFRLSTEGDLDYHGFAGDGEVEDYWFPLAMVGNLVWYDEDKEGDQNEPGDQGAEGLNDFPVYLCIPGDDEEFGTADDQFFHQMTKSDNGVDGKYNFCGLPEGEYKVGYNVFPDGKIPTIPNHAPKVTNDSEGLSTLISIGKWADNLPEGEASVGDNYGNYSNFPDNQVDFTHDFGFVMHPELSSSMAVMGVDLGESGCGNINATFEVCFENHDLTDLNNLRLMLDFSDPTAFGNAFLGMVGVPVPTDYTATTLPNLNPSFNGSTDPNMFDGASGLLETDQSLCYEFTVEIAPDAATTVSVFQIQGMLEGGAVNDSGVEIPDLINGGQFKVSDKSDSGRTPLSTNPGQPGDTGTQEDPTPFTDCWKQNVVPACNTLIQVSLDETGTAMIFGDMIVEDLNFPCNNGQLPYGDYFNIEISDASGNVIGNTVDCSHIGQTLTVTATHVYNCNSCWGSMTVEDKLAPTIDCDVAIRDKDGTVLQSGTEFDLTCDQDLSIIPSPTAMDNCANGTPAVYLISETETGDACDVVTLVRTFGSEDAAGNQGATCTQTIRITQPTVTFPEDVTWTCEQYAAYPNITDVAALHPLIDPAFAENLDPNWDDNQDDCTARSERDTDDCKANFAGTFTDCIDDSSHVPVVTQSPVHDPSLIDGLEDADVLEMTGSGLPNVHGLTSDGCKFNVTHADQVLASCNGVSADVTFKIVRTWTVLNWCTGIVSTEVQIIKVTDAKAPVITLDADFETELTADQYASDDTHTGCSTSGPLGVPTIEDNCSGADLSTIRLYTPAGEGVPQYDGAGNLTGFGIPAPYLATGMHTVTYEATDNCGNKSTLDVNIRVNDGIAPVPVCREFTQVALTGGTDGTIEIHASKFDEASYDNCSQVYFLVRKMDRSDDCSGFSESNAFTPSVHFCCENIGDTVNVILKVYDRDPGVRQSLTGLSNNSNECMIRVLTEDKTRPECKAPADVWINCDEVADNLDLTDVAALAAKFGDATATDNCGATVEESAPSVDMDLCGVGTVTRNWRATDNYGNRNVGRCQQVIMIMAQNNYAIQLPGDFEEECDDAAPAELTYVESGCDLLAVNIEEQDFPASPLGECKKIIKTWRVINWCEYDGSSAPIRLDRRDLNGDGTIGDGFGGSLNSVTGNNLSANHEWVSNGNVMTLNGTNITVPSTGYYEYKQHIKIFDNTAPEVTYDGDVVFCGGDRDEDPCTGIVNLPIEIVELCTNVTTRWELTAFSDEFTAANFSGNGTLSGRYPLGTHTVRYYVEDECRNISQLDITFEIIDCKAPTPACFNGLSVQLMPTGMVSVWATDFNASSFDYCHPIEFTANVVTDVNRDGFVNADDYLTTPPSTTEIMLDCNHVGSITYVQLWVGEVSNDDVNNWDYCVTYIEVQDNNNTCQVSRASIAGNVKTEKGESVADVDMTISGTTTGSVLTDNTGEFTFPNLTEGADYSVTPTRNDDLTNGVSTFDLIQISKHILNTKKLDSPYKMIAADANNSGNISTIDLIAIRKAILKVATEFPNNTSWRFVAKDQILDANPLDDNIIEVTNFNNITGAMRADFIAVKIGDVNGDAKPQSGQSVDNRTFNETLMFETEEIEFEAGEELEVVFSSEQMKSIAGYQFTMHFETKVLELLEIQESTADQTNFGQTMKANGILTASWNDKAESDKAFKLIFSAKAAGKLSELLSISSQYTVAEAYALDGEWMNVGIDFGTKVVIDGFTLYQNTPNPFVGMTRIGFLLPEATEGTLTVTDVLGRSLQTIEGAYKKGYNEVELNLENVSAGMLIYQLETPTHSASLKMRLVK